MGCSFVGIFDKGFLNHLILDGQSVLHFGFQSVRKDIVLCGLFPENFSLMDLIHDVRVDFCGDIRVLIQPLYVILIGFPSWLINNTLAFVSIA